MQKKAKLVAIDFDGTLAQPDSSVRDEELYALQKLGEENILRVIATGRSLFSADEVMKADMPIDYLVFSSGVGVMEWKTRKIIHQNLLDVDLAKSLEKRLIALNLDFMVHHPAPDNHAFYYHQYGKGVDDFKRRIELYQNHAIPLEKDVSYAGISQMLIIVDDLDYGLKLIDNLRQDYPQLNIVRTTSPLDNGSLWIEIFPKHVSKAHGIQFVASENGISVEDVWCVGNDYNDLDMLRYAGKSFVVANAPEDLKSEFTCIPSNVSGGVSDLLSRLT